MPPNLSHDRFQKILKLVCVSSFFGGLWWRGAVGFVCRHDGVIPLENQLNKLFFVSLNIKFPVVMFVCRRSHRW